MGWAEDLHPRDANGRFSSGGGGAPSLAHADVPYDMRPGIHRIGESKYRAVRNNGLYQEFNDMAEAMDYREGRRGD